MSAPRTLVRQYVLFVAVFVIVLSVGAFFVLSEVTRRGLEDLFRREFAQAQRVLVEYLRGRELAAVTELETLLSSPRFLATLETRDPATIADAVPTHPLLVDASFVRIVETETGRELNGPLNADLLAMLPPADVPIDGIECAHVVVGAAVYEVLCADVFANNGSGLARIQVGRILGNEYADDLHRLTGLDVAIFLQGNLVARTSGRLGDVRSDELNELRGIAPGVVIPADLGELPFLVMRAEDDFTGYSMVFLGSAESEIAPIMARVRRLLLILSVGFGLVATTFIAVFTSRRIGTQIGRLVSHAERIARGDLDFVIPVESNDELGFLATEMERMRQELGRNRAELESAHTAQVDTERMAAVGQMAAGIIHDFKSPMAVVQGTADLIRMRDPRNPKLEKQCEVIHRQVDRMVSLTRDVLEFSQGDMELHPTTVSLGEYLAEVRALHQEPYRQLGAKLELIRGPEVRILFDCDRMKRVLDNLLNNAREVSRMGDHVTISWSVALEGVRLEVSDQGPGVPPEIRATIFNPFVTAGKKGGSGLGLAISRKIVEDHGARIELLDNESRGVTFRITLPDRLIVSDEGAPAEGRI